MPVSQSTAGLASDLIEHWGICGGKPRALAVGEFDQAAHDGSVDTDTETRLGFEIETACTQESIEGIHARDRPSRLDPGDHGLLYPGAMGKLPLRKTRA